jgi:hypothetical protein
MDRLSVECVQSYRYQQSKEHNIRIGKHGILHSVVDMLGTSVEGAGRSGVFVESLCQLRAEKCVVRRNAHYGVQTMPKAEVILRQCNVSDNIRGELSGHNIHVTPGTPDAQGC